MLELGHCILIQSGSIEGAFFVLFNVLILMPYNDYVKSVKAYSTILTQTLLCALWNTNLALVAPGYHQYSAPNDRLKLLP
jgi:hypothetical protein